MGVNQINQIVELSIFNDMKISLEVLGPKSSKNINYSLFPISWLLVKIN